MQSSIFKNIIAAMLVALFAFAPVISIKEAHAQSTNGGYSYSSGGGTSGGLKGYLRGLAPAIAQLPLCQKNLFGPIRTKFKGIIDKLGSKVVAKIFKKKVADKLNLRASIRVTDTSNLRVAEKNADTNAQAKDATQENVSNDTCYKSIGRLVTKMLLQKMVLSTTEWIKNGFNGGPAFVQNPGRFFKQIAKDEILQFGVELNAFGDCSLSFSANPTGTNGSSNLNKCISPYARNFLKTQAEVFNKKFTDNARYSLNELIASTTPEYTSIDFQADFSAGGWNAWTAMTETPANNPLGFTVIANEEIGRRTSGTSQSVAQETKDALSSSNGFLGDYRCANPEGLTLEQHREEQNKDEPDPAKLCSRWEYVTPGATIAEAATKFVNYQDNNLLKAEDLNDAVAAIIDALLNRLMGDVITHGLAALPDDGADGDLIINAYATEGNYEIGQAEKDFPSHFTSTGWLKEHENFNIRTDLTQAIVDEQRTFIDKVEKQNQALERVILGTRQLDYCIPGPSPKEYDEITDHEIFDDFPDLRKRRHLANYTLKFDPSGRYHMAITQSILTGKGKIAKKILATHLGLTFGIYVYGAYGWSPEHDNPNVNQDQVLNKEDLKGIEANIFASYSALMHNMYFNGAKSLAPMPLVTKEARIEFNKLEAYDEIIKENEDLIAVKKATVQRLAIIKNKIEDLGPIPNPGDPDYEDYETQLEPIIDDFGRITEDLVTGDDVAQMDTTLKETQDKEKYIYEDLLGSCESEMMELWDNDRLEYSRFYRRQPYDEPIAYLYGDNTGQTTKSMEGNTPGKNHNAYDPHQRTLWSEKAVKNWNRNDAFGYASFYWNFWSRPRERIPQIGPDGKTPNPVDLNRIKENFANQPLVEERCPEFIDVVYFSYPGASEDSPTPIDIGIQEDGLGGGYKINYEKNTCGVLGILEDLINIY